MVERHLAKVDVAGSSPVFRSTCGYRISANTPAFQAGKVGSIPTTRSIRQLNVSCLFYFPNKSKLINIQYCNGNNKSLI